MATLGQQLKAAREAKGVSEYDAGIATKILTRVIVAMESDDFSGMAAPTYAKGFIRLYADYLGIDAEPLVEEYTAHHTPSLKPLTPADRHNTNDPTASSLKGLPIDFRPKNWLGLPKQLFSKKTEGENELEVLTSTPETHAQHDFRLIASLIAGILVLITLLLSIVNCAQRHAAAKKESPEAQQEAIRKLLEEPLPDLYLVEPGKIESSR